MELRGQVASLAWCHKPEYSCGKEDVTCRLCFPICQMCAIAGWWHHLAKGSGMKGVMRGGEGGSLAASYHEEYAQASSGM